jgi:hypothetical protein
VHAPSIASRPGWDGVCPSREPSCWASAHFSVAPCSGEAAAARRQAARLEQLPGVRSVTLNPTCGTLHVWYDGASITVWELRRCFWQDAREVRSCGHAERVVELVGWLPVLARAARALLGSTGG